MAELRGGWCTCCGQGVDERDEVGASDDVSDPGVAVAYGERVANGLILMGVRLYNQITGRFLQEDPIYGGNANAYDYCNGDPINCIDLDGKLSWSSIGNFAKKALDNPIVRGVAVGLVVAAICVGTAGIGCAVMAGAAAGAALGGANM